MRDCQVELISLLFGRFSGLQASGSEKLPEDENPCSFIGNPYPAFAYMGFSAASCSSSSLNALDVL
jgi:hypothetical protein